MWVLFSDHLGACSNNQTSRAQWATDIRAAEHAVPDLRSNPAAFVKDRYAIPWPASEPLASTLIRCGVDSVLIGPFRYITDYNQGIDDFCSLGNRLKTLARIRARIEKMVQVLLVVRRLTQINLIA
jgi:hypothetical protein